MNNKIKEMTYAALLAAIAFIIPTFFGFLRIYIPPFSATIASHVPMMLSILISPMAAVIVGLGSTIGFFIAGTPMPIVFRAATHIVVGYVGAQIIIKNRSYLKAAIVTAPIHGILEALVVIPFVGLNLYYLIVVTGIFTMVHHAVDSAIAYVVAKGFAKSKNKEIYNAFGEFNITKTI